MLSASEDCQAGGVQGTGMTPFLPISLFPHHMVTPGHVPWNLVASPSLQPQPRTPGLYSSGRPEGQGLNLFDTIQEGLWFRSPGSLIPAFCVGTNRPREGTGTWSQGSTHRKEGAGGRQLYDQVVI